MKEIIRRLVEALEQYAPRDRAVTQDLIADARKLLEDDALAQPADEDAWLNDAIKYAKNYGGHCRDCADNDGICPQTKLPCGEKDEAIRRVLTAILYGEKHGYLRTRPQQAGFVSVPVEQAEDAMLFRSLVWRFEEDRDMGPGGYWRASVHTADPKIRNDLRKVLIAAATKGDGK